MAEAHSCGCSSGSACCGGRPSENQPDWVCGQKSTRIGHIPLVSTRLSFADHLGAWRARWGIRRMQYSVSPGLYGVGNPDAHAPILATANYKMSFDRLRQNLEGLDAWILVLDTKGINVWCAAGKGTFGTEELVQRLQASRVAELLAHRVLILPQLAAPGVAAHEVQRLTGFKVKYGPVRAGDIIAYLNSNFQASEAMRTVEFPLGERLAVVPIELVKAIKYFPLAVGLFSLLRYVRGDSVLPALPIDFALTLTALLSGTLLFQALLPWLPFRSFIANGWTLSLVLLLAVGQVLGGTELMHLLILAPAGAYLAFNFTGASTFTSLSGVEYEFKRGIPAIIVSLLAGLIVPFF